MANFHEKQELNLLSEIYFLNQLFPTLKGQSNEIIYNKFFSLKHSICSPFEKAKTVSRTYLFL